MHLGKSLTHRKLGQGSDRRERGNRQPNALPNRSARGLYFCELARIQLLLRIVSTITAILEPHADGSLHLPVPAEMRRGKVKVIATLIPVPGNTEQEAGQRVKTLDSLRRIAARGGIKNIPDPARWQREIRQDRPLPGREE